MPDLLKQLRQLIDSQEVKALENFLTEHQTLNLNYITPNGLSALWWALNPPGHPSPSLAVIGTLTATNRINPTQTYIGLGYKEHYQNDLNAIGAIASYEHHYVNLDVPLGRQHNEQALGLLAANAQNTHDHAVVTAIDKAISKLYQRYCYSSEPEINLKVWLEKLNANDMPVQQLIAAQKARERIAAFPDTRQYSLDNHLSVNLTLQDVLNLIWQAVNDTNKEHFVSGIDMSEAEIINRKKRLITHLAMSEQEYPTHAACWMGTRNQIVACLDATHIDVNISQEKPLDKEQIIELYNEFCQQQLIKLEQENNPLFWEYLNYFIFDDFFNPPKPPFFNASKPSNDLVAWYKNILSLFRQNIDEYNAKLERINQSSAETLQRLLGSVINLVDEDISALSHVFLPQLLAIENVLFRLSEIPTELFKVEQIILKENLQTSFKNTSSAFITLQAVLDQLVAYLTEQLNPHQIISWLCTNHEEWAFFFNQLSEQNQLQWIAKHCSAVIDYLKKGEKLCDKPDYLWQNLSVELQAWLPELKRWLDTLPIHLQSLFIRHLIEQYGYPFNHYQPADVLTTALTFGLQQGYLQHLIINELIIIENQDLRGVDLSTVDLTNVQFAQCDLRLTSLSANPQISPAHLHNNQLDKSFLLVATTNNNHNAALAFINSNQCTAKILLQKNSKRQTALHVASRKGYVDIVKAILASSACTETLLLKKNNDSQTALLVATSKKRYEITNLILGSEYCTTQVLSQQNRYLNTLFHFICDFYDSDNAISILKSLLASKAFTVQLLNQKNYQGLSGLHLANLNVNLQFCDLIFASAHCPPVAELKKALFRAMTNNDWQAITTILTDEKTTSDLFIDNLLWPGTALHLALLKNYGTSFTAKIFIDSPAINGEILLAKDDLQRTALHLAIDLNDLDTAKKIINSRYCNPQLFSQKDNKGNTALHLIIKKYESCTPRGKINAYSDFIKAILDHQDFNFELLLTQNNDNETPILLAISIPNSKFLVYDGALTNPAEYIIKHSKFNEKLLHRPDSCNRTIFDLIIECDRVNMVQNILPHLNATHLVTAFKKLQCEKKQFEIVKIILPSLNINDLASELLNAIKEGLTGIVKIILEHPNFNSKFLYLSNKTILHVAIKHAYKYLGIHNDIIKIILYNRHCSKQFLLEKNNKNKTCLNIAVDQSNYAVIELLKRHQSPDSYYTFYAGSDDQLTKAHALLNDYCKNNDYIPACVNRFFHGHWNRHHTSQVDVLLAKNIDNMDELISELDELDKYLVNRHGSLARRITFIKKQYHLFQLETAASSTSNIPGT